MGRPRLLFLGQALPYPPDGGVSIRMYHTLRILAGTFEVTALLFYRRTIRDPSAVSSARKALSALASVQAFPIPQEESRIRWFWDHLRSVASNSAYTRYVYASQAFGTALDRALSATRFDVAHMDSLDLVAYLPRIGGIPVFCSHHNVESSLLRRRAVSLKPLGRQYLRHQAALIEREEREWLGRVDVNIAVSEADASALRALAPGARVEVLPNGVDTEYFAPHDGPGGGGIVSVGGTSWHPNLDGLEFLTADILPRIRKSRPDTDAVWVGRATASQRKAYARRGIELTGYVEDVRPFLRAAACFVAPLRFGGGTKLKILDAWAMGKAIVATPAACEGLEARDGENILIRSDPGAFSEAVVRVLEDDPLRRKLEQNARRTAEGTYSWRTIGQEMTRLYREFVNRTAGAA